MADPHGPDERLRWIDRRDRVRPESGDELSGQRPRATPDVEHPLTGHDAGEIGQLG